MNLYPPVGDQDRRRYDPDHGYFVSGPEGRFSRGLSLGWKSWQVIRSDRSLLALPALQILLQAIAVAAILVPIGDVAYQDSSRYVFLIGIAAVVFPVNFLATFVGVAFVFVVRGRLEGRTVCLGEALRFAGSRIDVITWWAILSTAVTVAIQALERVRGGAIAARIAGWLIGAAWGLATLFVVPALASERIGPIGAAKKSVHVVKQKWGEGIVGSTAIGIAFGLWTIPVIIVGAMGWVTFSSAPATGTILMAIAVAGYLLISAAEAAVDGVFRFVLFDYAENGTIHGPFTQADLDSGLKSRSGGARKWLGR